MTSGKTLYHTWSSLQNDNNICYRFEPSKVERAKANLTEADLIDLVEIRQGDALQTFSTNLPAKIDLVLLDGAKGLYLDILRLLEGSFRPGTLIVADNADHSPEYIAHVRAPSSGYISVPFDKDVELSMRV